MSNKRPASAIDVPDRDRFGIFVRRRRRANRMTQAELAELAGVGVRFVSELERGKPTMRADSINAVLAVFGMELGIVPVRRRAADEEAGP